MAPTTTSGRRTGWPNGSSICARCAGRSPRDYDLVCRHQTTQALQRRTIFAAEAPELRRRCRRAPRLAKVSHVNITSIVRSNANGITRPAARLPGQWPTEGEGPQWMWTPGWLHQIAKLVGDLAQLGESALARLGEEQFPVHRHLEPARSAGDQRQGLDAVPESVEKLLRRPGGPEEVVSRRTVLDVDLQLLGHL